jgi:hypothetical protein
MTKHATELTWGIGAVRTRMPLPSLVCSKTDIGAMV